MRRKLKIKSDSTLFGTKIWLSGKNQELIMAENLPTNWTHNQTKITQNYRWFRAPQISAAGLEQTAQGLAQMAGPFELEVWQNADGMFDASVKFVDEMDAAEWAWTHTSIWQKWDQTAESEWAAGQNKKPAKIKINKNGSVKVRVQVTELSD